MIQPDAVDHLFQPFQRLGNERIRLGDGPGLGLAIVRAIATVHGAASPHAPGVKAVSTSKSASPRRPIRRTASKRFQTQISTPIGDSRATSIGLDRHRMEANETSSSAGSVATPVRIGVLVVGAAHGPATHGTILGLAAPDGASPAQRGPTTSMACGSPPVSSAATACCRARRTAGGAGRRRGSCMTRKPPTAGPASARSSSTVTAPCSTCSRSFPPIPRTSPHPIARRSWRSAPPHVGQGDHDRALVRARSHRPDQRRHPQHV